MDGADTIKVILVDSVQNFKNLIDQYKQADGIYLLVKRMQAGLMVIHLV